MIYPYEGSMKLTNPYNFDAHKGIDVVGISTKKQVATIGGVVEFVGWDKLNDKRYGFGYYIRWKGTDGLFHYYCHCSEIYVKVGDTIKTGQIISKEGNTGHSFGSHLHYEVRTARDNTTHVNIAEKLNIPNREGVYSSFSPDYIRVISKYDFSKTTMDYLNAYKFADEMFHIMLEEPENQRYQLQTIKYILDYPFGDDVFKKLYGGKL